jgi:cytochrome P450
MDSLAVGPPTLMPDGVWMVSRHADVRTVLRAGNVGTDTTLAEGVFQLAARSGRNLSGLLRGHGAMPQTKDGADHVAARRVFACHAARLLALDEPAFGQSLDHSLETLPTGTLIEAIQAFVHPLVDAYLVETLGVSIADINRQRHLFSTLFESGSRQQSLAELVRMSATADALFAEATAVLHGRGLAEPTTNDLGAMIFAVTLAGDVLRGLFAQVLGRLAIEPDHQVHLREDPTWAARFVQECLRFSAVVPFVTRKVVADEIVLPEAVLRAGDRLCLDLGSANRDPDVFIEPDRFMPDRRALPHLAFAAGPHTCQGARSSKSLAETFVLKVVNRFKVSGATEPLEFLPGRITRVPVRLSVAFHPIGA